LIWENILSISRNMSRMAVLYHRELGQARLQRVLRLLAAFPYLLRHHIQPQCLDVVDYHQRQQQQQQQQGSSSNSLVLLEEPINKKRRSLTPTIITSPSLRRRMWTRFRWNGVNGKSVADDTRTHDAMSAIETTNCDCWIDTRSVPWCLLPTGTLDKCISASNRPLWICDRLSQEMTNVAYTPNFTSRERLTLLSQVDKLSICIGECERIQQTAVPLNYARHSIRSLTIWLVTLPFAIVGDLGMLTGPVMGVISWLLLGVYQIGYTIEDPFQRALRLSILCDSIYRDVMAGTDHMERRNTAFDEDIEGVKVNGWNKDISSVTSLMNDETEEDEDADPLTLMKRTSDQDPSMFPRP
jgi:predicted membrane chloride channel (bestrophin family)